MSPPASRFGAAGRVADGLVIWGKLAWWGLVSPRVEREPLVVVWAAIFSERGVLLSVRSDLWGWELPGGNAGPGESDEDALLREVREETGLEVAIERHVGDYVRSGFRPHTARVYRCRVLGGELRPSRETPRVEWFDPAAPPKTLFPWYRTPLADALAEEAPAVTRHEHWGVSAILAGMRIDLAMRRAG